ncbi:MAG: hydroxymethylbilane synthase, partial [Thermoguttaceae bacterium]|nr:hydroxymethylbilane synthase [Thermoguttaceae bacterium]
MSTIRIATRQSALAKWQADWVASQLERLGFKVEMVYVTTHGDVNQSGPIESIGTQG